MVIWLLSHQRSGSHFLRDTLNSANGNDPNVPPVLVSPGECLTRYDNRLGNEHNDKNWNLWDYLAKKRAEASEGSVSDSGNKKFLSSQSTLARPVTPSELDAYFLSLATAYEDQVFLGDVKINQLHVADGLYRSPSSPPLFLYQMIEKGKVIFLTRGNLLDAYLSGVKAAKTNVWHSLRVDSTQTKDKSVNIPSLHISPEQARWGIKVLEADILVTKKWLDLWGASVLHVTYEHLFDHETGIVDQQAFHCIATFCGLPTHLPWRSALIRNASRSNLSEVANRIELEDYFRCHGEERWFSYELERKSFQAA